MVTKQTVNSFNNNIILKIFLLYTNVFSFTMYKTKTNFLKNKSRVFKKEFFKEYFKIMDAS